MMGCYTHDWVKLGVNQKKFILGGFDLIKQILENKRYFY
jgi:hypothetical protein